MNQSIPQMTGLLFPNPTCHAYPTARRWCPPTADNEVKIIWQTRLILLTIGVEPTNDYRHRRVGAYSAYKKGTILQVRVIVDDEQNDISSQRDQRWSEGEEKAVVAVV